MTQTTRPTFPGRPSTPMRQNPCRQAVGAAALAAALLAFAGCVHTGGGGGVQILSGNTFNLAVPLNRSPVAQTGTGTNAPTVRAEIDGGGALQVPVSQNGNASTHGAQAR